MHALVAPSSSPGRQMGQHLIDGNSRLGIRNVLVHSPLNSLNSVDEKAMRFAGNEVIMAVQKSLDQTFLEQLNANIRASEGKASTDVEPLSVGSCTTAAGAVGREDGVAEFKGPVVHGLVRFAQVNDHEASIEADFDGLSSGGLYSWSVNEYGDLREGAASTGGHYSPLWVNSVAPTAEEAGGIVGNLIADNSGHVELVRRSVPLAVWDVIGRSVVLYRSSDDDQEACLVDAVAAAVIARSSVRGTVTGGAKRLCACDGTLVWQSR